jgi:hypothetical protein
VCLCAATSSDVTACSMRIYYTSSSCWSLWGRGKSSVVWSVLDLLTMWQRGEKTFSMPSQFHKVIRSGCDPSIVCFCIGLPHLVLFSSLAPDSRGSCARFSTAVGQGLLERWGNTVQSGHQPVEKSCNIYRAVQRRQSETGHYKQASRQTVHGATSQ